MDWQPIESAPVGKAVLLYVQDYGDWPGDNTIITGYRQKGGRWVDNGMGELPLGGTVRYWQPLPAPPSR